MKRARWYEEEMAGAVVPDARYHKSLPRLVASLARHPNWSWSRAVGHAGRQSARRLGRRVSCNYQDLLAGHFACTAERCRAFPTVLMVQDTTVDNYFTQRAKRLGPTSDDPDGNGLLAHTCLAVSPSGVPLGLMHLELWVRDPAQHGQKAQRRQRRPEEKESRRWRETAEVVQERLPEGPEVFVVEDREGDNFHFLSVPRRAGCHLLCRMAQARSVVVPGDAQRRNLLEVARQAPVIGHKEVELGPVRDRRGRVTRAARTARLAVQVAEVEVQPPRRAGMSGEPVRAWVVRAAEVAPPAGQKPLEWVLVCTKPVETERAALQMVGVRRLRAARPSSTGSMPCAIFARATRAASFACASVTSG